LGAVANPADIRRGRRKAVEELARDLDPAHREAIIRILETWNERGSPDELRKMLGKRMTNKMLAKLKATTVES
jgi:hypothetical protein